MAPPSQELEPPSQRVGASSKPGAVQFLQGVGGLALRLKLSEPKHFACSCVRAGRSVRSESPVGKARWRGRAGEGDLPLDFHPVAIRASAGATPFRRDAFVLN